MGTAHRDQTSRPEPPLWSIGLAVTVILLAPIVLYSLAPTGPLREGDTIFSEGQQRVLLRTVSGTSSLQEGETCLLDPGNPLIIIRPSGDRPDDTMLAQVQGNPAIEWPFCPPHAEVLLRPHQVYQKPDILVQVRKFLLNFLGR